MECPRKEMLILYASVSNFVENFERKIIKTKL